jgi:hypothetical protein
MSFRFYKNHTDKPDITSPMVEVSGDKLVEANLDVSLPSSCDYSLKDLLAAGVKVAPVDPSVIHDSTATSFVADSVISHSASSDVVSDSVEPSKND